MIKKMEMIPRPLEIQVEDDPCILEEAQGNYHSSKNFVSLIAWQNCRELKMFCYENVIPSLPKEEAYNLGSQIRRAAVSTTANIAEGYGRFHDQECIQFFRITRGSLYELKDHLIAANDLGFISDLHFSKGKMLIGQAKRTVDGYISYLEKQKRK